MCVYVPCVSMYRVCVDAHVCRSSVPGAGTNARSRPLRRILNPGMLVTTREISSETGPPDVFDVVIKPVTGGFPGLCSD